MEAVAYDHVDYMPRGGCAAFYTALEPEVLAVGPAGTGKTLAACWKLHHVALRVPQVRILMARKVLEDLKAGALATYTNQVQPILDGVRPFGGNRFYPGEFRYGNGSVIQVVGMDKPGKVMSAEYDVIYVNEATELHEEDWESLKSRLRNGRLAYQQLIGDCNPAGPRHWLKNRCDSGMTRYIHTTHHDNPMYWDAAIGDWTTMGYAYVQQNLAGLTGHRRKRLFEGVWAAAEGAVYQDFNPQVHVKHVDTTDWGTVLAVDVGTRNPTAILTIRKASDDRRHVQREVYRRGMSSDEIVDAITAEADATNPEAIYLDPSANDYILTLQRKGYPAVKANNDVTFGIGEVTSALANGLTISPACVNLIAEMETYHYPEGTRSETDKPVKEFDHACFVAGTMVATTWGPVPIEHIRVGDPVHTRAGLRRVQAAQLTNNSAAVLTVRLSDGERLTGTGDHPVWVDGSGWVRLDALRYGDILHTWIEKRSSSTELRFGDTPIPRVGSTASTSRRTARIAAMALAGFTKKSGSMRTATFQKASRFITSTSMLATMTLPTLLASRLLSTSDCTPRDSQNDRAHLPTWRTLQPYVNKPKTGIARTRDVHGTESMGASRGRREFLLRRCATNVARLFRTSHFGRVLASARISASQHGVAHRGLTIFSASVSSVGRHSHRTNTTKPRAVPVSVLSVTVESEPRRVYSIAVSGQPEFFANGVLVHNCDALRYGLASEPILLSGQIFY